MVQKTPNEMVDGSLFVPGDIKTSFQNANHNGWLLCDGSAVSRATYADLFALIGTTYGVGDGATTFNLPDCRDRFLLAVGATHAAMNETGGAETVALTAANLPAHTHTNTTIATASTGGAQEVAAPGGGGSMDTGSVGTGQAVDKMPPFIVAGSVFIFAGANV